MDCPLVTFVIPTYQRAGLLSACLDSIDTTVGVPFEIICVTVHDDQSTQTMLAVRTGTHDHIRNIVDDTRTGFVRAANRGMRAATGEYIVQLNDDCRLMPYAIENALHMLRAPAHRDVGQLAFFHDTSVSRNIQQDITIDDVRYVVCHVRGLCFANFGIASRALYERLGYFDEQFHMYGADPDFSLKVWHEAGLRVLPCPGALVRHLECADDRAAVERPAQRADNVRLFEKWGLSTAGAGTANTLHQSSRAGG
jgi:GT2 family glycosyltransferase